MQRRRRNVKILATLGPASDTEGKIAKLFDAGADGFRINMSHTDHELLAKLHGMIRNVEREAGRPIAILADLQGPKIRVGTFAEDQAELEEDQPFRLDLDPTPGDATRVQLPHPEIFRSLKQRHSVALDDGRIRLHINKVGEDYIDTRVVVGGIVRNRKGVNVPDSLLPLSAMSQKDHKDLAAAADLGVDWIALSFVQRPDDVAEAKKAAAGRAAIMAKIERPQALEHLDAIVEQADGIMVARGDLGVELPVEKVPIWQKRISRMGRRHGKPVVIATQMLESMITSPMPTRAEVSDVSTAVYEGADVMMLSAESAAGQYPVQAVSMMNRIAESVESDPNCRAMLQSQRTIPEATTADALMAAAHEVAQTVPVAAIVCYTQSGATGLRGSRERPSAPILVLTPREDTARRLALAWGTHCVLTDDASNVDDMLERATRFAVEEGFARRGDRIVVIAGVPFGHPGSTNLLRVAFVDRD